MVHRELLERAGPRRRLPRRVDNLSLPFVVWLFFAYPTGRLQTTAERGYISAFVAWEVVLGIVVALTLDPRAICAGCIHGR